MSFHLVLLTNHIILKYCIYIFFISIFFTSCVSDSPWYEEVARNQVSEKASNYFAPKGQSESFAMDSVLYDKLIESGTSDYCAMISAFAMSDVELERQLPNRCHSQYYKFGNCIATMLEDTVTITFRTQNLRRSIASNKIINVKVLGNDHYAEIIHWGRKYREVSKIDGTKELRKSPTSEIINTKLKLNKRSYSIGDTIIGEIKITSYQQKGRRKTKVKEYSEGKFRAIIGGYGVECIQEKSLATSWIKS
ncbi:MAG: hypothetical protein ACI86M_001669 [Saprospiraceae bacterium]